MPLYDVTFYLLYIFISIVCTNPPNIPLPLGGSPNKEEGLQTRRRRRILATSGNEGKTFIQKYIEQHFGTRRVFKGELNTRDLDIGYVLSRESLACKDIFLFNLKRSDTRSAYGVLESLKDGYFVSNKYHSKKLKIIATLA